MRPNGVNGGKMLTCGYLGCTQTFPDSAPSTRYTHWEEHHMKEAWKDRGSTLQWGDVSRAHHVGPFIGPSEGISEYDVLMHIPDRAALNQHMPPPDHVYTSRQICTRLTERARACSVPTTYSEVTYSETTHSFCAMIRDITVDEDRFTLPGSSQVTIEQRHVNAFNEYGTTPVFINNKTVSCVYDSLL
jgi:hypothetical protein